MDKEELKSIFRELGADDPEGWATSELDEGIPQLARFMFLKGAWDKIVSDTNTDWIDNLLQNTKEDSTEPFAGCAHSIRRMLAAGVSKSDIAQLVRGSQAEFLHDLCYIMDDAHSVEGNEDRVDWVFFAAVSGEEEDPKQIIALHESILETDPTGRECRPLSDENAG